MEFIPLIVPLIRDACAHDISCALANSLQLSFKVEINNLKT